ncbi:hypothetical protein CBS101457_003138 [Exobasidium rhododendri]|nr:hypothetical protein CBS101457_003138 [Exobasidium rhododendri]
MQQSGGGSNGVPGAVGSSSWRLHIHPLKPFHEVPFLLSCSPSNSLYSLRERIAKVLSKYGDVQEEHVMLFVSLEGTNFALVEDGPLCDLVQNGEKIVAGRDEALWARSDGDKAEGLARSGQLGKRKLPQEGEEDDDDDIMAEANRIAQKMKSEIGCSGKRSVYEETQTLLSNAPHEPEWPLPPSSLASSTRLLAPPSTSTSAVSAMKAFEEKKRLLQGKTPASNVIANGKASSPSPDSSSSEASASSSSSASSSDDSPSSSSSSDNSSSSSESSSSSNSSSSSSSSDSSSSPSTAPIAHSNAVSQGWVPPGQGLPRTQRNNRSRRQKKRTEEERRQGQLFEEAKKRSEMRARGEEVDEAAVQEGWLHDTKGRPKAIQGSTARRVVVVARDGELVLPPGGGNLGFLTAAKGGKSTATGISLPKKAYQAITADEMAKQLGEYRKQKDAASHPTLSTPIKEAEKFPLSVESKGEGSAPHRSSGRRPPPPSMRDRAIPEGVTLTSVDCDEYYNEHGEQGTSIAAGEKEEEEEDDDEDEEDVNEEYAAFQAKAKAALQLVKDEEARELQREEESKEQNETGKRFDQALTKAKWTDGNEEHILNSISDDRDWHGETQSDWVGDRAEDLVDGAESGWTEYADLEGAEARLALFPDMPITFGKKEGWDGNDVLLSTQKLLPQKTSGQANKKIGAAADLDLDYGEPDSDLPAPSSYHRDLQRLRAIRDQEQAKALKTCKHGSMDQDTLQKARLAALATRKKQLDDQLNIP